MPNPAARYLLSGLLCAFAVASSQSPAVAQAPPPRPSVFQTTLEEPGQLTPEITTEELLAILASNSEPVFDVRFAKEYAIAHIPGTINVFEKEVERIVELHPDRATPMILYCNGPSCGKSKRTSESLVALGYTHVRRYQLGMPVWRALSQTVQTDMPGADYIFRGDRTAVWVDARTPAEFTAGSVPGAVNVQKGEATAANDDGRLPLQDKGTRVVVFANTAAQARVVAAEVAKKAYWNSSYFGGDFNELLAAGFINHPPVAQARNATVAAGASCTATIAAPSIDNGSFDPDSGDVLTLAVDPPGPFALGDQRVSLLATDRYGRSSAAVAIVTVADRTAPVISDLAVDTPVIRRHGDRVEVVTVAYSTADNCGPVTTELMVSSSADDDERDHRGRPDFEIVDAHHVRLAVDREGHHDRVFWITVAATDAAGNRSTSVVTVRVTARRD